MSSIPQNHSDEKALVDCGLCQVFVGTFFVFRNSVEKLCVSWALSLVECVAVWALKLPVPHTDVLKPTSHKVFLRNYWNPKEPAANICHKPVIPNSVFLYLINAFRNAFLDAVAAASINGTWPLINSTYRFPFPSFFDVFAALNVSMISFMRALKINPSVYFSMVWQSSLFSLQLRGKVIPLPSSLSFLQD